MKKKPGIFFGCDHAGAPFLRGLQEEAIHRGFTWAIAEPCQVFLQSDQVPSLDYALVAPWVCAQVYQSKGMGVLICGSGQGMAMVANRFRGIRAALCHDMTSVRLAREHNNANILVLGARLISFEMAKQCFSLFIETPFQGGRHEERLARWDQQGIESLSST